MGAMSKFEFAHTEWLDAQYWMMREFGLKDENLGYGIYYSGNDAMWNLLKNLGRV